LISAIAEKANKAEDVITESMAEIWAKQGNKRKAIDTYSKLSFIFPEKSVYFASQYRTIKTKEIMITLFIILIIAACVGLGFMVLIQNPKGGGLNANVGGLTNNFMGVKQTTDVSRKRYLDFCYCYCCFSNDFYYVP
jgi:protein translocase SecG subunit